MLVKQLKKNSIGTPLLGEQAYEYVKYPDNGFAPPTKGYKKPFDYHLWNQLRKMGKLKKHERIRSVL